MDPNTAAVGRAYGAVADRYVELIRTTPTSDDDLALIERHLTIRPGVVLDAGCGPGHLTAHLRMLGVAAVGFDVVPAFVDHARTAHPGGRYGLASLRRLPVPDGSVAGVLAWFSLIHLPPDDLDGVLAELRRALAPAGRLVVGFFDGAEVVPFDHQVTTAWYWPADVLSERLGRAGFTELERRCRPGVDEPGHRPPAALAALAS